MMVPAMIVKRAMGPLCRGPAFQTKSVCQPRWPALRDFLRTVSRRSQRLLCVHGVGGIDGSPTQVGFQTDFLESGTSKLALKLDLGPTRGVVASLQVGAIKPEVYRSSVNPLWHDVANPATVHRTKPASSKARPNRHLFVST